MSELWREPFLPFESPLESKSATAEWGLRWIGPRGVGSCSIEYPALGPLLIPIEDVGVRLAGALLEALDVAAESGERRVRIARESVQLFLEAPAAIEPPLESPSLVVGGDLGTKSLGFESRKIGKQRLAMRLTQQIGAAAVDAAFDYPRQRRALAATERRIGEELRRCDQHLVARQRVARGLGIATFAGLAASFAAVMGEERWLMALGAGMFVGGAAGIALERRGQNRRWNARHKIEARLSACRSRIDQLDREAQRIAQLAGCPDPWDLAARLEDGAFDRGEWARQTPSGQLLDRARELANRLDLDPLWLDRPEAWDLTVTGTVGWPLEVRTRRGPHAAIQTACGLARLLERIALLPEGWPLVLWEPWPDDLPELRARRLMAISAISPEHPVVAIVAAR